MKPPTTCMTCGLKARIHTLCYNCLINAHERWAKKQEEKIKRYGDALREISNGDPGASDKFPEESSSWVWACKIAEAALGEPEG